MQDRQGELPATRWQPPDTIVINGRCLVRLDGKHRIVVVDGVSLAYYVEGDRMAEAYAIVCLVEQGGASQVEVARALGRTTRTVRRHQRRYDTGGLAALGRPAGYPRGRPRAPSRDRLVGDLKAAGLSNRAIGQRIGVSEKAVRNRLRRLGWKPPRAEQLPLALPSVPTAADPNLSAPVTPTVAPARPAVSTAADPNLSAPVVPAVAPARPALVPAADPNLSAPADRLPPSYDEDAANRRWDRLVAYLGLLDDAAPLFRDGAAVPGAGVLVAVPDLLRSGVLSVAQKVWGSIGPAFYGLRTTLMTMLLMALLRIQRPEALKERSPSELGRILGLDRAPEVKTLRRKIARLAEAGGAELFGRLLAQRRVAAVGDALGFLYLDGHVRVYYGRRRIPKTHAARLHSVMPATTDYWINDQRGDPLLVVTAQANAGMCAMLPALLKEIRALVGERRLTVVFDRGGWSPQLFAQIVGAEFDLLTYRKGPCPSVPQGEFREHRAVLDGREVVYQLAEQDVALLDGQLILRQVTRRSDEHQTHILTSRRDLSAIEIAWRMFERWRQENFFKYLRQEFLVDALVDYGVEPDDPERDVPNPKWAELDEQLTVAQDEIAEIRRLVGTMTLRRALSSGERMKKALPPALAGRLSDALTRVIELQMDRSKIPRRVPVAQVSDGPVIKLATQRKHLTNLIKMVAYQAESDLVRAITPSYRRTEDDGRTLIHSVLASAADLRVTPTELHVTLAPMSSPHRSRAVAELCERLNAKATLFPGTRLQLRYAVAPGGG